MKKPHVGRPVGATAIVTLTVEVRVSDAWGPDCSVAQVHRQAAEAAIGKLRNMIYRAGSDNDQCIKLVGTPEVKTVITERA